MRRKEKLKHDFNPNATNEAGQSELHFFASEGNEDGIVVFVTAGADVNKPDKFGMTPLHYAALNGHIKAVGALIKSGADVNATSKTGHTPADLATFKKHDVIAVLLKDLAEAAMKKPPAPGV
jgi:cytohesin